jgi:hypothetical protein
LRRVSVNKFFGIAALAACLSVAGADEATAAGPYYIHFVDYCDCITVQRGALAGHKWFVGTWDWECTGGESSTLIHGIVTHDGEGILGTQPVDSNGDPAGFSATFHLESAGLGSDHAHVTATFDGTTNVLVAEEADYFIRTNPNGCNNTTKPRMFQ